MKIELLYDNPWLQLKKMIDPENGVNGYVYSSEIRSQGHIISILPYRQSFFTEYLLRKEVTPCWSMHPHTSSITGGMDKCGIVETVIHEMKEEAGYEVTEKDLISLGTCFGAKSSDTVYHLYSVNLSGKIAGIATGDGSELEKKAHCFWINIEGIFQAVDPLVYVSYIRLNQIIRNDGR